MKNKLKLIVLIIIVLALPYPAWYGVNYYAAGLVDQTQLIEFGLEDDFFYCNEWRPELFDPDKEILTKLYGYRLRTLTFNKRTIRKKEIIPLKTDIRFWACKYGSVKLLKVLISKEHSSEISFYDLYIMCLITENIKLAEYLLTEKKVKLNTLKTRYGNFKYQQQDDLTSAIYSQRIKTIKFLIEKGVDLNVKDNWENRYLKTWFQSEKYNYDILELFVNNGIKCDGYIIHKAVDRGDLKMTELLLKGGASVNITLPRQWAGRRPLSPKYTPLDNAKSNEMKKLLIKYGGKYKNKNIEIDVNKTLNTWTNIKITANNANKYNIALEKIGFDDYQKSINEGITNNNNRDISTYNRNTVDTYMLTFIPPDYRDVTIGLRESWTKRLQIWNFIWYSNKGKTIIIKFQVLKSIPKLELDIQTENNGREGFVYKFKR